ncbi:MAG: MFS transporter [bacterium]|nr:MFS transporter [bacterium]
MVNQVVMEINNKGNNFLNPFRALKNQFYFYFWFFQGVSLIGNWVDYTLRQWIINIIFSNPNVASQFTGNFNLIRFLPSLFFSFISGSIIDRWGYKKVLIFIQIIDFLNACLITYLVYANKINGFYLLILGFIGGITMSFYFPARSALIKNIIKEKDLTSAFSLQGLTFNLSRVVGPIIAAFLAKKYGIYAGFLFNCFSFLPLIFLLIFSKNIPDFYSDKNNQIKNNNIIKEIKEVLKYIYDNKLILKSFMNIAAINFLGLSLLALLQVFTKDILKGTISNFSLILSLLGIGAIIGAIFVASLSSNFVVYFSEEVIIFLYGVLFLIISFFPKYIYYLMPFIGLLQSLVFGISNNRVQIVTDSLYVARVISLYSLLNISLGFLGAFILGNIAYFTGLIFIYKLFSLLIVLFAIFSFLYYRKLTLYKI